VIALARGRGNRWCISLAQELPGRCPDLAQIENGYAPANGHFARSRSPDRDRKIFGRKFGNAQLGIEFIAKASCRLKWYEKRHPGASRCSPTAALIGDDNVNPLRIAARDRRLAAIHEAGHYVVARWRGLDAYAYIAPTHADDPLLKTWVGQAMTAKSSDETDRLIGVAGTVAENCWRYRNKPGNLLNLLEPWLWENPDMMSRRDWQRAHTRPGNPSDKLMRAVSTVHAAFNPSPGGTGVTGHLWPDVCSVARDLIIDSRPLLIRVPG
jgi:hypothetical protein